uniref:M16 family metallopeptidase n=1 Tax=Parerythrobacter lutipelagi TaxID=1964208 RepID=UPI0010F7B6C1|nr:insulinase family protein [Parerythrobacter lutipelagi]
MHVKGGWQAERPGENGLVHLIEHLPREANGMMSPDEVIAFRDQATVVREWGAFTSPYASEYFLTTQTNDVAAIANALRYFRGIVDGMRISAEPVDQQRQTVINEMAGRLPQAMRLHERARELAPGSEWDVSRGYDSSDVASASVETIEALYARIYRPENVTIVIVGDVDAAETNAILRSTLGMWSPPDQNVPTAMHLDNNKGHRPAAVATLYTADADASGPPTVLASLRLEKPKLSTGTLTSSHLETAMLDRVIALILSHRLDLQALETGVGSAKFTIDDTAPSSRVLIWQADPAKGKWHSALSILLDQVAAAQAGAFSERELAIAKRVILRDISDRTDQALFYSNSRVSASIGEALTKGFELQSEQDRFMQQRRILADMTLDRLNAIWRDQVPQAPFQTRVEGAADQWTSTPSSELAKFVKAYEPRPLGVSGDSEADPVRRQLGGTPGAIVSDLRSAEGIRSVTFANGSILRLIDRKHQGKYLEIAIYANAPEPRARLSHCDALVLPHFVQAGGTSSRSEWAIRDELWGKDIRNFPFEATAFGIRTGASVRTEDASVALRNLYAFVSDPGFREAGDVVASRRAGDALREQAKNPLRAVVAALESRLTPGTQVDGAAMVERCVSAGTMARASTLLHPILTRGHIDAAIAGSMDEDSIIALFASTFGQEDRDENNYTPPDPPDDTDMPVITVDLPPASGGQEIVGAVWAMDEPADAHGRAKQELFTALFARMIYIDLVEQGTSYSPQVERVQRVDGYRQPILAAAVTAPRGQAADVAAAIDEVGKKLAESGPDLQLLETIRAMMINGIAGSYNQDRAWAYQAAELSQRPNIIRIWRGVETQMQTITADEIGDLARETFARPLAHTRPVQLAN